MKKVIAAILAAMVVTAPVQAAVRMTPSGVLVSDTCVTPYGQRFTFFDAVARVGTPCYFVVNYVTYYGRFG